MIKKLLYSKYKVLFVFILLLPWVIPTLSRPSIDYGIFTDTARGWLSGQIHLYDGQTEFYFAPYAILAFVPFTVIPQPFGQFIFAIIVLAALVWATWKLTGSTPWWTLAIGLATVYTALLVFNGQWDSIVLAGLAMGWIALENSNPWLMGFSFIVLGTKPTNILLPALLLLFSMRNWSKLKLAQTTIIPLIFVIISGFIAGWNWPLTYISNYREHPNPPNYVVVTPWTQALYLRSYWEYLDKVGTILLCVFCIVAIILLIRRLRFKLDRKTLSIALAINLVASPHALLYCFIFLAPIHILILNEHRRWGLLLYGAALIDLIFIWLGIGVFIFPLVTLLVIMIIELMPQPVHSISPAIERTVSM